MRLTLCANVRDERENIEAWLEGFRSEVDEIVIGDTGSTDGTPELLQELGIEPLFLEWTDDFSAARNAVIEKATGDWILLLDADERVTPEMIATLRIALEALEPDALGGIATVRNLCNHSDHPGFRSLPANEARQHGVSGVFETHVVRVFRNDPRIRLRGRVHELVEMSIDDAGGRYVGVPLFIDHPVPDHGSPRWRRKEQRYASMLEQKVEDDPTSAKAWWEVGSSRLSRGDVGGALGALREAWKLAPGNKEIAIALAGALVDGQQEATAIEVLAPFEELDARAAHILGIAHGRRGNREEATAAFQSALDLGSNRASTAVALAELIAPTDAAGALACLDAHAKSAPVADIALWSVFLLESTIAELAEDAQRSDSAYEAAFESADATVDGTSQPIWERELGRHLLQLTESPTVLARRLRLAKSSPVRALTVARALATVGDHRAAAAVLDGCESAAMKNETSNPNEPKIDASMLDEIQLVRGRSLVKLSQWDDACADLVDVRSRQADENATIAIDADYWLSRADIGRGDLSRAAEHLHSIVERDPRRVDALIDLAGLHGNSGRRDIALQLLEIAATLRPDDSTIHHNLAICALLSDPPDLDLAQQHRDRAIDLGHAPDPEVESRLGVPAE